MRFTRGLSPSVVKALHRYIREGKAEQAFGYFASTATIRREKRNRNINEWLASGSKRSSTHVRRLLTSEAMWESADPLQKQSYSLAKRMHMGFAVDPRTTSRLSLCE